MRKQIYHRKPSLIKENPIKSINWGNSSYLDKLTNHIKKQNKKKKIQSEILNHLNIKNKIDKNNLKNYKYKKQKNEIGKNHVFKKKK
jgi:hypothetical protein